MPQDTRRAWAEAAAPLWDGTAAGLTHVLDSGSHTYRLRRPTRPDLALRLTGADYRTPLQIDAEVALHQHLAIRGVRVPAPIAATTGRFTGRFTQSLAVDGLPERERPTACAFEWLPGRHVAVDTTDPDFGEALVRAWGAALGAIHTATTDTPAVAFIQRGRWHWRTEAWIADDRLFARERADIRRERQTVLAEVDSWPEETDTFGLVHGDLGPRNLLWEPDLERATPIDFANTCLHFRAMDLVIAAGTLAPLATPLNERATGWLLDGYRSRAHLDAESWALRAPWLRRLRRVYALGSRLWKFGPSPTPEQDEALTRLRRRVREA